MKKRQLFILIIVLIALLAGCAQTNQTENDPFVSKITEQYPELKDKPYERDQVGRVIDGDTFETVSGAKVRLIGVNTPEVYGGVEYYGREASAFSKDKLSDAMVYMFQDVSDTDRYGRLLRYVFIENELTMFNETLVIEGYANVMTYPPDVTFSEHFVSLERQAREQNIGLWNETADSGTEIISEDRISQSCEKPTIKGNINSRGEKIYHMPDGRYYKQTKAEQMFCTEEEAVDAGFRKAKQ